MVRPYLMLFDDGFSRESLATTSGHHARVDRVLLLNYCHVIKLNNSFTDEYFLTRNSPKYLE